ncbi:MAG: DUF3108 domain-containing protein [Rhodocyclaceae bacterium]|nr:DUF3108 domain-containing protein [Rhodocyclaceae bacterium]
MLLPFWLALAASLTLHVAVLMAPGWELPLEGDHEAASLDAILVAPAPAVTRPAPHVSAAPAKKRLLPRPAPSPTPAAPVTPVMSVPDANPPTVADPAPSPEAVQPEAVPVAAVPPAPTFASQWPRSGRIVYQVTRGENGFVVGQSEQRWEHDGTRYTLHAEVKTTGLAALFRQARVVQESRGVIDAAGLRPLEFATQRDGRPSENVRFDPAQERIYFGSGQGAAYTPAAQDLLSLFFQLGLLSPAVPRHVVTVATARKLDQYTVTVGEVSLLEVPLGQRMTRYYKVLGKADEDATEIWLDVDSRLPLKIRHRDRKGEVFDQVATVIELEKTE